MTGDSDITAALPDYVVERELGQGGMGVVFLGRHARLGRMVAIKELPPAFAADADVRERFSTEARTLATLSHPHIVPIYDYVERDGLCLIVMEQLPGGTVWDRFTTTGLTPPTACAVALACCAALQHAHTKGVLHLDVKPDNLMFASDAAIKVTDFGISRVLSGDHTLGTLDGQVLGTPAYMSPEQARGSELTPASDVYSAGIMLYELLSGHLPWTGAETATDLLLKRLREDPRPLYEIAPQIPRALADVVMHAIEREPEARYGTAEEFGLAIATACADSWGPDWLDQSGVAIIGAERLSLAARATRVQAIPDRWLGGDDAGGDAIRATGTAPQTIMEGRADADSRHASETTTAPAGGGHAPVGPSAASAPAPAPASAPTPPPAAPPAVPVMPHFDVVRAAGAAPRIDGANLNRIDRAAFVDVSEVIGATPGPRSALAIAAVLVVAAIIAAVALFGGVSRTGDLRPGEVHIGGVDMAVGTPTLDLSSNLPIVVTSKHAAAFANRATLKISMVGVPLSSINAKIVNGRGTFDTSVMRHVATGSVTARVEMSASKKLLAHSEGPASLQQPWYLTLVGVGSVLVILAGLAYLESALRPLRKARRRISSFIGCGISAAVTAVGIAGLIASLGHAQLSASGLIAMAVLAAGAGIALGVAVRRRALHKGVRQAVSRAESALARGTAK